MTKKKKNSKENKAKDKTSSDMDLDEITKACLEIDEEIRKQQNRSNKRNKRDAKNGEQNLKRDHQDHSSDEESSTPASKIQRLTMVDFTKEKDDEEKNKLDNLIKTSAKTLVDHMNQFGACVIDNFLGNTLGSSVLEEILHLKNFKDGQVANKRSEKGKIRGDKITWSDGADPPSPKLKHLIHVLDSIIITANMDEDNGELSNYQLTGRTQAMIACYPGEGTHYVTHVDNPNRDGRCITAIYYLNKDWDEQTDGGTLRIYSQCLDGVVAEIAPIFDRMLFFWSDRRNPHEVLPSYKHRYAMTLWYMDEKERREYEVRVRRKYQEEDKEEDIN